MSADTLSLTRGERVDPRPVTSVAKALWLLGAVADSPGPHRLDDLAAGAALPRSTAHRLLRALQSEGFVQHVAGGYRVGSRLTAVAETTCLFTYSDLRGRARRVLHALHERSRSTVHLAVLEGPEVVYLEKLTANSGPQVPTRIGSRMPASCTALGKAILSFSDRAVVRGVVAAGLVRSTPYSIVDPTGFVGQLAVAHTSHVAMDREESRLGVSCIASPVLIAGQPVAAVSVCFAERFDIAPNQVQLVRAAALQIARELSLTPS